MGYANENGLRTSSAYAQFLDELCRLPERLMIFVSMRNDAFMQISDEKMTIFEIVYDLDCSMLHPTQYQTFSTAPYEELYANGKGKER